MAEDVDHELVVEICNRNRYLSSDTILLLYRTSSRLHFIVHDEFVLILVNKCIERLRRFHYEHGENISVYLSNWENWNTDEAASMHVGDSSLIVYNRLEPLLLSLSMDVLTDRFVYTLLVDHMGYEFELDYEGQELELGVMIDEIKLALEGLCIYISLEDLQNCLDEVFYEGCQYVDFTL